MTTTAWYGRQRMGFYLYTEDECRLVVGELLRHCPNAEHKMSIEDFQALCEPVSPRQVQQILSDRDGIDYLLNRAGGIHVCATAAEARKTTQHLRKRAASELERVVRREQYAERLPTGMLL